MFCIDAPGPEGIRVRMKLDAVLDRNEGYNLLLKLRIVLEGGEALPEIFNHFSIDEVLNFKYAPLTSTDVERVFSRLKYVLSDRRRSLTLPNLAHHLSLEFHSRTAYIILLIIIY